MKKTFNVENRQLIVSIKIGVFLFCISCSNFKQTYDEQVFVEDQRGLHNTDTIIKYEDYYPFDVYNCNIFVLVKSEIFELNKNDPKKLKTINSKSQISHFRIGENILFCELGTRENPDSILIISKATDEIIMKDKNIFISGLINDSIVLIRRNKTNYLLNIKGNDTIFKYKSEFVSHFRGDEDIYFVKNMQPCLITKYNLRSLEITSYKLKYSFDFENDDIKIINDTIIVHKSDDSIKIINGITGKNIKKVFFPSGVYYYKSMFCEDTIVYCGYGWQGDSSKKPLIIHKTSIYN